MPATDSPTREEGSGSLLEQRRSLPDQPGVYLFRDGSGRVIYVGKAKSVRKRVASHFSKAQVPSSPGHAEMIAAVAQRRVRGGRHRGGGAAGRAELHQAVPAALQHPPARRQVLPVHRDLAGRGFPARLLHPRAPPRQPCSTSAPTPTPSGCGPRSRCSRRCSCSAPARAPSPGGAAATPASTTTSSAARLPAWATSRARTTARASTAWSTSSPAASRTSSATSSGGCWRRRAEERFEQATLERNRLQAVRSLLERRRVAGASPAPSTRSPWRSTAATPTPRSSRSVTAILSDRQSFYLENATEREPAEVAEEFMLQYYGGGAAIPSLLVVQQELRRPRGAARGARQPSRRAAGDAGRRARREAAHPRARRSATRCSPSTRSDCGPSAAARRGWRRSRGCSRRSASTLRRSGSSASTSPTSAAPTPSPRWSSSRAPRRRSPTTAASRSAPPRAPRRLRRDGRGALAALRAVAAPARDLAPRPGLRRQLRRAAQPRRDRRRQGPAGRRAGAAGGLSRAGRGRDRARQADRGGLPPGPSLPRWCSTTPPPSCSCCSASATRPTASPSPTTAAAATRAMTSSVLDELPGIGPARKRALLRHFGSHRGRARGLPRAAPERARAARRRSAASCTAACGGPARSARAMSGGGARRHGELRRASAANGTISSRWP